MRESIRGSRHRLLLQRPKSRRSRLALKKSEPVAPSVAPADTPRIYGSAIGFWTTACITQPQRARPLPARKPRIMRGIRICQTICSNATDTEVPVSVPNRCRSRIDSVSCTGMRTAPMQSVMIAETSVRIINRMIVSRVFSYRNHPLKWFEVSFDYLQSILQAACRFVYGQFFKEWTILKNRIARLLFVKRAGTVQPSLFLPKFPLCFLASCRNQRAFKSSRLRSGAEQ